MDLQRIDALVAERVMGWTWNYEFLVWDDTSETRVTIRWHPTTDGNDMLLVVERMEKQGLRLEIEPIYIPGSFLSFLASFHETGAKSIQRTSGSTIPLAVCLAALRVVLPEREFVEVIR